MKPKNDDAISREMARGAVYGALIGTRYQNRAVTAINILPALDEEQEEPATWYQKRLTIPKGHGQTYLVWACSKCHNHEKKRSKFCPNCGKPMIEVSE